jgi:hypothetical protein
VALTRQRQIGLILAIFGWLSTLFATLYPSPDHTLTAADTGLWCLVCGELGMVDVALNLVLFVPFGLGLGLLGIHWARALLVIALTTFGIEVLQLSFVTGRDASLSDLLTNSLGGASGMLLGYHWRHFVFPTPGRSLFIAVLFAVTWLGIQAFTVFAFERTLPRSVYYGQWAPDLGHLERYTGRIVSVTLDSTLLPSTRLAESRKVRELFHRPGSVLTVKALTGQPTADLAPIFSIFDDQQREIVLLGQDGRDLVYRVRTRTAQLGLRSPALHLGDVLPARAGVPIELRARYHRGHYFLETTTAGVSHRRELALSASWGWSLLLPFDHSFGAEMPWLTMLWVGGLLFPLGYFAARAGLVRIRFAPWMLMLLIAGLVAVPALAGFSVLHPLEWVAGLLGGLAGQQAGIRSRGTSTIPRQK